MPLVCAMNCVGRAHSFVVCFVDLAVHFAGDRVMPILVAFVPAVPRIAGVNRAGCAIFPLMGFLIDAARELRDRDTASFLADVLVRPGWWHRRPRRNCKSAKRNRQ